MKTLASVSLALSAVALLGTASLVQAEGLTREQVKAELAEAIRSGNYVVGGEMNLRLRDISPGMYPADTVVSTRTRDEVKAELAEAIRTGDIIVGEKGETAFEQAPHRYPARPVVAGKTREQVNEELALAIRLGDMPSTGEDGLTMAQRYPHRFAAVRAEHQLALKARQAEQSAQHSGAATVVR